MITRIVKLGIKPEKADEFLAIFEASKEKIRNFEGCQHLQLLRETAEGNFFFTYSHWDSEEHLNRYRASELFQTTWNSTKVLFNHKPEAWSVDSLHQLK